MQCPADFPFILAFFQTFAFVVHIFAATKSELNFHPSAIIEVKCQRHHSQTFCLDAFLQADDFAFVQQQPPVSAWGMIVSISLEIGSNMSPKQKQLPIVNFGIGIRQRHPAGTTGFHFSSSQLNAGFKTVQNGIIMTGFFILSNIFH